MKSSKILWLVLCCAPGFAVAQNSTGKSNSLSVDFSVPAPKPSVIWQSPDQLSTQLSQNKMTVKAGIQASGKLKSATLYVNGLIPNDSRGMSTSQVSAEKFDYLIEKEVNLSNGPNEIKIVAENTAGLITTETRLVNVTVVVAVKNRTDYALIIATDNYNEWSGLNNPIFDASTIAKELEENYGFKVDFLKNPTKAETLRKIREYNAKNYLPDDQFFVFIAGHGKFDELIKDGFLVSKDSKRNDDTNESYIPFSTLSILLNNNPCRHVFLTMDACFGGTFDQAIAKRGDDNDDDPIYSGKTAAEFIEKKLKLKSRIYLTSGGKEYVSDGRANKHSPFAYFLSESLRTYGGKMKVLTTNEVRMNVERMKSEPRYGFFGDNEPGSEFVFQAKSN
jgi:Caspase domain